MRSGAGKMLLLLFVSSLLFVTATAQVFENDAQAREKRFVYEVVQLTEFFKRFNNDSSSVLRKTYRQKNVRFRLQREALLKSLFNYEGNWDAASVNDFVKKAMLVKMPSAENYYGEGWYAELNCVFTQGGNEIKIPVVLQLHVDEQQRSKWLITGVRNVDQISSKDILPMKPAREPDVFITPVGNDNYFIELNRVFADVDNLSAYFDENCRSSKNSSLLCSALIDKTVVFKTVREIKYHFLQVADYIFTVEHFRRQSLNAGWLINKLLKADETQKQKFRNSLLGKP